MKARVALALSLALFTGCSRQGGAGGQVFSIRASLILDQSSEWYAGLAKWKELVEKRTGGRVRVTIRTKASLAGGKPAHGAR